MDQFGRFETPGPPARIVDDGFRDASHTYEVQAFTGYPIANSPLGRWNRGHLVRSGAPVLALPPNVPQYDPAQGQPASWARQTS